jgi:hypothetical protein
MQSNSKKILEPVDRRKKKLKASVIAVLAIGGLTIFFFPPAPPGYLEGFSFSDILFIIYRHIGFYSALLLLLLRIVRVLKNPNWFIYIFFAIFNLAIGILDIGLFCFQMSDKSWLITCQINTLLGAAMSLDGYLMSEE